MASEKIVRTMYNGAYEVTHNPFAKGSQPRYVVENLKTGEVAKPKGVTTILGATLAKDLISWAVGMARDYLTAKHPEITLQDIEDACKQYTIRRDKGADTGSEAHAMVENFLKGYPLPPVGEHSEEAEAAFWAFKEWFDSVGAEVINVEEVIFSPSYNYCGTYDCMLRINGKIYLCDLKTTNASSRAPKGVYAEMFIQLGAYAAAHHEHRATEIILGNGTELLKIDGLMVISARKDGKLDVVTNEDVLLFVDECEDAFKRVVEINKFLTSTTKELGGK